MSRPPTDTDSIERVARQQLRQLNERHAALRTKAAQRDATNNPLHSAEATRAEADGVLKGVIALEEVMEIIDAVKQGRPD